MKKFAIVVILATASLATGVAQGPRNVLEGVYTAEQAERGHVAYETHCVGCHEGLEADGPELMGRTFMDRWREDRLQSLFAFIKGTMPGNTPGSLDDRTYTDIIAFVLEANKLPEGKAELQTASLPDIQLVGLEGPRPMANLSIVRSVGCLTAGANNAWSLAKATTIVPVRTRIVEGTTPEELKESAAQALGGQSYPLMSVTQKAVSLAGHKVQVKGVLTRQGTLDRINVMSLESVAATCGA